MLDRLGLFHSDMPDAQVQALGPLVRHGSVDLLRPEDDNDPDEDVCIAHYIVQVSIYTKDARAFRALTR